MRLGIIAFISIALTIPAVCQKPEIFDIGNATVGPRKLQTLWFHAVGKWSDASVDVAVYSTEIECYKRFGFCNVASAIIQNRQAVINSTTFDILRWDSDEIIAVDSSPICMVNTLRVDVPRKRVTLSSSDKGDSNNRFCKGTENLPTAVLLDTNAVLNQKQNK